MRYHPVHKRHLPARASTGELSTGSLSPAPDESLPIRLLLIEDNEDDVALTARSFRVAAPHVQIDAVTRGSTAIERAAAGQYDAAVLDYKLPDMDGMEVLHTIAAPDLPVIIVTGRGDERLAVEALKAGAVDYLVKDDGYLRRLPQAVLGAVERNRLDKENRRLAAETARQASLLSAVLTIDPGAVAVLRGPDFRFELANATFCRLVHAADQSVLLGRPAFDLFPVAGSVDLRKVLQNVYETGRTFHLPSTEFQTRDGLRYFHIHLTRLDAATEQEEPGIAAIIWDMTTEVSARRRVEELAGQAEAQRELLQAVIDQMPEGVHVALAADTSFLLSNRAAVEILGERPVYDLADPDIPVRFGITNSDETRVDVDDLPLQRALWHGETVVGRDLRHTRADGARIDLLISAAPIYDARGSRIAAVAVFQDITRIKDVERIKDEFMSIASHELRTPLTNIKATAQLMLRRVRNDQSHYTPHDLSALSVIVQQSSRMARLIDELLDVTRLQTGNLQIKQAPFDLTLLVEEVVSASRLSHPSYEFNLQSGGPVRVIADRDRIAQVLSNLLDNAVKYSRSTENRTVHIAVSAQPGEQQAVLQVRDYGVGFEPAHGEQIFERFSRLGSVANHSEGMGLGLFISRQIIEAHGGEITGTSDGPGTGATFTIVLPLSE